MQYVFWVSLVEWLGMWAQEPGCLSPSAGSIACKLAPGQIVLYFCVLVYSIQ